MRTRRKCLAEVVQAFGSVLRCSCCAFLLAAWVLLCSGCSGNDPAVKQQAKKGSKASQGSQSPSVSKGVVSTGNASASGKKTATKKKSQGQGGYAKKKDEVYHEPLFEGWQKPEFTLFFTGQQRGYVEPCGCTGLANQKGGLMRRDTFLSSLAERGWNPIPFDVGNQVRRQVRQSEIKFYMTVEALKKMKYQAVAFGPEDVQLSFGELAAAVDPENKESPFICANVHLLDSAPQFRVIQAGSRKIGVTAVMSDRFAKSIVSDIIEVEPADKALARVTKQLVAANVDVKVLLVQAGLRETKELIQKVNGYDLVVTAGGAEEPAYEPTQLTGNGLLIQIGGKGMYAGVVGYFPGGKNKFRYQRAPMDSRFKDSQRIKKLFIDYQEQLRQAYWKELGLRPRPHESGRKFVGSQACKDCHSREYEIWETSKHAHGTKVLVNPVERASIPRHFDPECLSCHVTGWNVKRYEPYSSGFLKLKTTPKMTGVGCENCHGPGSKHVHAQENDLAEMTQKKRQLEMRMPLKTAERKCMVCHDLDNSPDFHVKGAFQKYWKKIAHGKSLKDKE